DERGRLVVFPHLVIEEGDLIGGPHHVVLVVRIPLLALLVERDAQGVVAAIRGILRALEDLCGRESVRKCARLAGARGQEREGRDARKGYKDSFHDLHHISRSRTNPRGVRSSRSHPLWEDSS